MEIIRGTLPHKYNTQPLACALGFFDGVHRGHQNLVRALKDISAKNNYKSMVFTFEKHPMTLLDGANAPKLITDNDTKSQLFRDMDIDLLNYCHVDYDLLNTRAEEFIKHILMEKYNVKAVVAGFNFRFGFKGEGDSTLLEEFGERHGLDVIIVNPVYIDGQLVSSTAIRKYIMEGRVGKASLFLGRHFYMSGKVTHGKERGRKMGIPTANILPEDGMIVPKKGVYITSVEVDGYGSEKIGVTNVGQNPTFGNSQISIETHIIDLNEDIYDRKIRIIFHRRLRDEVAFKNASELSNQIEQDKVEAIQYFNNNVYK